MASLYILRSASTGKFYIGSTIDLERRLSEHNREKSLFTRGRGPWELVYREEFPTSKEARRRELQIKSWKSHLSIQKLIEVERIC